ncbi:MAG: hypothetical protein AAGD25_24715 [Cyanobacteria bacterium P01_F01_bin.150]
MSMGRLLIVQLWSLILLLGLCLDAQAAIVAPNASHLKPIQVTTTADTGKGSLRWAIAQANIVPDDVGYGGGGGGFGGAIFIRSGRLTLYQTSFERNTALSGTGVSPGQGKGGATFITPDRPPETTTATAVNFIEPTVLALGKPPKFIDNVASDAAGLLTDNNDVYGLFYQKEKQ